METRFSVEVNSSNIITEQIEITSLNSNVSKQNPMECLEALTKLNERYYKGKDVEWMDKLSFFSHARTWWRLCCRKLTDFPQITEVFKNKYWSE